jgi:transposase
MWSNAEVYDIIRCTLIAKERLMHLKRSKREDGREYISIVRSYREGGKTKNKTYQSLGYLDPASDDYEEKIAEYQKLAEELEEQYQEENGVVALEFSKKKKIDMKACNRKNAGYAVLSGKYYDLKIDLFWRTRAQSHKFAYDPNAIFRLLVNERCLSPGSKKSDWENRAWYFDRCDFSEKDVYRSLDFFASYKDDLIARINKRIAEMRERNTTEVYYDTTNYYFEIDENDLDEVDESGEVIDEGLRKRGVSKEHRKSPIVSMGLLMDSDGIPIHYELFPGNTNDCLTAMPVLKKVRKEYDLGRIIMVADKGINTSDNIAACILDKNGYVFSQSVKKSDEDLKKWVLSDTGYVVSKDFKCKSKQGMKTIYVKGEDGTETEVPVEVKYVAFWSADYDKRAKMQRLRVLEKAGKLTRSAASYEHAKSYGAARYVKETTVDADSGEVMKTILKLDEEQVLEDERYDGYYLIITSETAKTESEIIEIYRGLWRIEESFKVTKSSLNTRPVFVWTKPHIEAHFLVCYIALTIVRLIQADFDYKYSAKRILTALAKLECSHLKDNIWHFDYRTVLSDELCANAGITLNREIMTLKEIKNEIAKTRKH